MTGIQIYPSPNDLAIAAADHFVLMSQVFIQEQNVFSVALSGGSTPKATYQLLAETERKEQVDWSRTHLYWGDERCVSPDDEDSNYRMVYDTLIQPLGLPVSNIHRMQGELKPHEAAKRYETILRSNLKPRNFLDMVFLGMGDDGHTASLFPQSQALNVSKDWVTANYVQKLSAWRITLTASFINRSPNIVFLVSGERKAAPLFQVLQGNRQPNHYPSQLIDPVSGDLFFLVDQKAAQLLQET